MEESKIKTGTTFILSLAAILTLAAGSAFGAYSGGTGEPNTPYQIANKDDLLALAANTADYGKCFILTANIDMQGQVFTKAIIAADTDLNSTFHGTVFTGTFDGNGHKIAHFTINGNDYLGLFGCISSGGSVKNLGLENCSVSGSDYVGGLVGANGGNIDSSITNCYSTGFISGSSYVGGLVGLNYVSITNCYSIGTVSGSSYVGGLVGSSNHYGISITNCYSTCQVSGSSIVSGLVGRNCSSISNCYSTGTVSGSSDSQYIGGLVGINSADSQLVTGSISNCYSTGTVSGGSNSFYVGGLVGANGGTISNCYSIVSVSGDSNSSEVGGLVGDNGHGIVSNCYSMGTVSGGSNSFYVGGLVGANNGGTISNCYSTGTTSGSGCVGGLVGYKWAGNISNCSSTGQVSGTSDVGGLVGGGAGGSITNCHSTGQVSSPSGGGGGLVGYNGGGGGISSCYSTSTVSGGSNSGGIGGLVGYNEWGNISNCYSTGTVSGNYGVGGLVGINDGSVSNCYSIGAVSGQSDIGGLVGINYRLDQINNCYSTGMVSGTEYVGGFVGYHYFDGWYPDVFSGNFWDIQTSGQTVGIGNGASDGVSGMTTSQMKTLSTFTSAGWNFANVWNIIEGQTYPFLRGVGWSASQPPADPPAPNIPPIGERIEPNEPGKNKLIVLVHGWVPLLDFGWITPGKETDWPIEMSNALWDMIHSGQIDSSWTVLPWGWYDRALQYSPDLALVEGIEQGKLLADSIADPNNPNKWQHVHFIAHSAGSAVIAAAASELVYQRLKGKFSGTIHLTFLDPYTPLGEENTYGMTLGANDWADNYYTVDRWGNWNLSTWSDTLFRWTSKDFKYAHNVNISEKDPGLNYHDFPHQWYYATITGNYPNNGNLGDDNLFEGRRYGFPRSREAGESNWLESLGLPENVTIGAPLLRDKVLKATKKVTQSLAESYIKANKPGAVSNVGGILQMFTQSPVWAHIRVEMPQMTNYIKFTYQFDGAGDGYLTAYFNENLILIGDQRFDSNQPHDSGQIMVGDLMQDYNWLTFRLDPIGQEQANISISNIEIGTITNQTDLNEDLIVNFIDFAAFANKWAMQDCNESNGWCQGCDFDQNGDVDVNDMVVFAANWLWKPPKHIKTDLNFSGAVDFIDFSLFANHWSNDCNSPDWCYGSDFDKSGKVDMLDLATFARYWLAGK